MTVMMVAAAAPAMADVRLGGSHESGFTSVISSSNFGDSSDIFVFSSRGSDFGGLDIEGSRFDFD